MRLLAEAVTAISGASKFGQKQKESIGQLDVMRLRLPGCDHKELQNYDEWESKQVLARFEIPVPDGRLASAAAPQAPSRPSTHNLLLSPRAACALLAKAADQELDSSPLAGRSEWSAPLLLYTEEGQVPSTLVSVGQLQYEYINNATAILVTWEIAEGCPRAASEPEHLFLH